MLNKRIMKFMKQLREVPLPLQNILIEKALIFCLSLCVVITVPFVAYDVVMIIPGMMLICYFGYDLYSAVYSCLTEAYSYVMGECILKVDSKSIGKKKLRQRSIDYIRVILSDGKDLMISINKQKEVRDLQEGSMVGIYIPDKASVYTVNTGIKIDRYYCIVQID